MDFSTLMQAYSASLVAKLAAARAALKHSGQKGAAAETALIDLLRATLPANLGLTEGIVVASSGYVSPQQDIIIYDASESPVFFHAGSTKAIPIEYVYAVVEVKSVLAASDVTDFSARNVELRSQQKFFVGDIEPKRPREGGYTYHQAGKKWHAPPVNAFMFGYESPSLEAVWGAFKDAHATAKAYGNWIDAICIGQDAYLTRQTAEHGLGDTIGSPTHLVMVTETPFLAFVGQLWLHSIEWRMRERPALFRYLKKYSFGIAKQETFVGIASHPDRIV
jgi:hypothetical protein